MENNIILPNAENLSLDMLADMLNMDIEDIYDLTPEQLSDLTIQLAEDKSRVINEILDNRNTAHTVITNAQQEYGITKEQLTEIYFDELKEN